MALLANDVMIKLLFLNVNIEVKSSKVIFINNKNEGNVLNVFKKQDGNQREIHKVSEYLKIQSCLFFFLKLKHII